ncbi:MAG: DNA polymerase III subunit beta [Bacteroidota bacterium]|nr:DNA polymerase III subunit beta [Bacteroidota bacterium]
MKFHVSSSELQKALMKVNGVVPTRSTLPILENLLFNVSGNILTITATDLEIAMSIDVQVSGIEDGKVAIPAKRIIDTVRALPETKVMFSADVENNKIKMVTENGEYALTGESSDEFPATPQFKTENEIEIDIDALRRLINKTSFAVSTDELRPAMMGILFQVNEKELCAVATDGHRLVRTKNKTLKTKFKKDIDIPAKALNLIAKFNEEGTIKMYVSESHVMFQFQGTMLVSRLIEENYPNYESVIPQDNEKRLTVNTGQLLASVRRVSLYSSTTTHQIRMSIKGEVLSIAAEDIDFGSEAKETIPCSYTSEPMEIGFNSNYVTDILTHIESEEVVFQFNSPTRAGIVLPKTQKEGEDVLMLVMPVRLNN